MKVRVLDEKASVHSGTDVKSPIVAELHAGDEFSIGDAMDVSGVNWCTAALSDGKTGYIADSVEVFRIRPVPLAQSTVDVLESPADGSKLKATYKGGDRFILAGVMKQGETEWVEVRADSGDVGFIPAGTEINEIGNTEQQASQPAGAPIAWNRAGILMIAAGLPSLGLFINDFGRLVSALDILTTSLAFGAAAYSFAQRRSPALVCIRIFVPVTGLFALSVVSPWIGHIGRADVVGLGVVFLFRGGAGCLLGLWALWTSRNWTSRKEDSDASFVKW